MYKINNILEQKKDCIQPVSAANGVIPKHPFRMYAVGASQSGKTNLICSLLSEKRFYKGYYPNKNIFIISPTSDVDPTYDILNLDKKTQYIHPNDALDFLDMIQSSQQKSIEKSEGSFDESPKILLIFDDCLSYKKLMKSQQLLRFSVMSRHFNVSMIFLSQAYHGLGKSIRMNMSSFIYFKASSKEDEILTKDLCAPGMTYKSFIRDVINEATKERYNFLYINLQKPFGERYKKNLDFNLLPDI